jgi:16S rRNA (guanine966-N2)-methyltransferase
LRIIGGRWRGRRLEAPPGDKVRPTSDKVREAWMSIVHPYLLDARVLDLFAGSGALGLEALSRGAKAVDFVESDKKHIAQLEENIEALGADAVVTVHRGDAVRFLDKVPAGKYDLAFADPPYRQGLAREVAERWLDTRFASVIGIEHESDEKLPSGGDSRQYGSTSITFFGERFSH